MKFISHLADVSNRILANASKLSILWLVFCTTAHAQVGLYLPVNDTQFNPTKLQALLAANQLNEITVRSAQNWHHYQQRIRKGAPGIYLAAPHYTAWLIHQYQFTPMLHLPEQLKYVIAVRADDTQYFELSDLAERTVCTQHAFNQAYLLLNNAFKDKLHAAKKHEVWSVYQAALDDTESCQAYSLANHLFEKFNRTSTRRLIRLAQSVTTNNYAFVADASFDPSLKQRLIKVLTSKAGLEAMADIYARYSPELYLTSAKKEDYAPQLSKPLEVYWQTH